MLAEMDKIDDTKVKTKDMINKRRKLEDQINEMVKLVLELLDDQYHFLILNAYSLGFSSLILENLLQSGDKKRKVENPIKL